MMIRSQHKETQHKWTYTYFSQTSGIRFYFYEITESTNYRVTFFSKTTFADNCLFPYYIQLKLLISKCCFHNPSSPVNAFLTSFMRIWSFITTVYRNSVNEREVHFWMMSKGQGWEALLNQWSVVDQDLLYLLLP